jgi:ATP-binding cassette subfamily C (CFTR/MRP) protein 1
MALADFIIVLEDGRIIETGKPSSLLINNGYVNKLGLSLPAHQKSVDILEDPQLSRETSNRTDNVAEDSDPSLTDIRRKNGEMSVYKYYLKNAGYLAIGMYVLSVIIWIFCTEFSSKFQSYSS